MNTTSQIVDHHIQRSAMASQVELTGKSFENFKELLKGYKAYERMLEWLLHQAGHKDGRIPKEECAMIEKTLSKQQ